MSVRPRVFLLLSLVSKECLCECQATGVSAVDLGQQGMFVCQATGVSAVEHGQQWILLQVCLCWYLVSRELCMTVSI